MLCLLIAQLAFSKPNILHVGKTLENKNVCMSETGNKIIVLSCNIRFMIKHSKSKVRGGGKLLLNEIFCCPIRLKMNTVICSTSQEVQSALQSPRQGRTFLQALSILLLLDSLVLMTHCPLGPEITYQEKLLQHRIVAHSGFFYKVL